MFRMSRVITGWILAATLLGAACGRDLTSPSPPVASPTGPSPPAGPITVAFSGTVLERTAAGKVPAPSARVTWCDVRGCAMGEPVVTGEDGRYAITAVDAAGYAYVSAYKAGFLAGRSPSRVISGDFAADVEIRPEVNGVFGVVSEATPTGPRPLSGAQVTQCDDPFTCSTPVVTAADGRFRFDFGEWSGPTDLWVEKPGFQWRRVSLDVFGMVEVNIELQLDDGGYRTGYLHLSQVNVVTGQRVARGDLLGYSGNTGCSTGPHLHFEVRGPDNRPTDPYGWQGDFADPWEVHPNGRASHWLWLPGEAPRSPAR